MRRMAHATQQTAAKVIRAVKVKRDLNIADAGTHYLTKAAFKAIAARALNTIKDLVRSSA